MDLAPINMTFPHKLGKAEAMSRLKSAIEDAKIREAAKFKVAEENWEGDRLNYRVALLGLPCTGTIDVGEDNVRAEVKLSWYLSHMVNSAEAFIQQQATQILSGP